GRAAATPARWPRAASSRAAAPAGPARKPATEVPQRSLADPPASRGPSERDVAPPSERPCGGAHWHTLPLRGVPPRGTSRPFGAAVRWRSWTARTRERHHRRAAALWAQGHGGLEGPGRVLRGQRAALGCVQLV